MNSSGLGGLHAVICTVGHFKEMSPFQRCVRSESCGTCTYLLSVCDVQALLSHTAYPESQFDSDFNMMDSISEEVHYSVCLPLFSDATRSSVAGVLEVVCLDNNVAVEGTVKHLVDCLQVCTGCPK